MITKRAFKRFVKKIYMEQYKSGFFTLSSELLGFMITHKLDKYWDVACDVANKKFPKTPDEDKLYFEFRFNKFIEFVNEANILC